MEGHDLQDTVEMHVLIFNHTVTIKLYEAIVFLLVELHVCLQCVELKRPKPNQKYTLPTDGNHFLQESNVSRNLTRAKLCKAVLPTSQSYIGVSITSSEEPLPQPLNIAHSEVFV